MRVLGVDPSSSSTGVALAVDGVLDVVMSWQPRRKKDAPHDRLLEFEKWFTAIVGMTRPDAVIMEVIHVGKSHTVTRILSRYESAVVLVSRKQDIIVKEHAVSEARAIVFEKGNISKLDALKAIRKMYPNITFANDDESDAAAAALAGPGLLVK